MPRRAQRRQLDLPIPPTWGGARRGAGRRPSGVRSGAPHDRKTRHDARHPVHVTLRRGAGVPSLRSLPVHLALRAALAASNRAEFRVLHYSAQIDHLHLIVEADTPRALTRGLQGLAIRCARAVNRSARRRGPVWSDRFHSRPLRTPTEMRRGLAYVLLNFRKHLRASADVDPCSSGPWFEGWRRRFARSSEPCPVAAPKTWLAAQGWRRAGGAIDGRDAPAVRQPEV